MKKNITPKPKQNDEFKELASKLQDVIESDLTPTGIHIALLAQVEKLGDKFGDYSRDELDQFAADLRDQYHKDQAQFQRELTEATGRESSAIALSLSSLLTDESLPEPLREGILEGITTTFNAHIDQSELVAYESSPEYIDMIIRGYHRINTSQGGVQ